MLDAIQTPYLVPFDGSFRVSKSPTQPPKDAPGKSDCKKKLKAWNNQLEELQRVLYAFDYHSLLLVFQAMDAAGKDSTIRAVLTGINPAGCQVFSFKQPSAEELEHDFLWRTACRLPERGRIGVFNRSYYEEVLVVKVHPEYLQTQNINKTYKRQTLWEHRYESIRDHEKHLARNGTMILKFWLNVSQDEQKARFLDRLDKPEKNWKFSVKDVQERQHWGEYMAAYEEALRETSRPWAPWYAIPADDKPFMRMSVAETIVKSLETLNLKYPTITKQDKERFALARQTLVGND